MSIVNIKERGVKGDGASLETEAIQKVIDSLEDGDTLLFPKGYYVTGTISLRSNITIKIDKYAEIVGSRNIEHYRENGFYHNEMKKTISLIYALDCENITIEGPGKIQLSGDAFSDYDVYKPGYLGDIQLTKQEAEQMVVGITKRPTQPIFFNNCKNIKFDGVKIFNSPCWTIVFSNCENVTVQNVYMDNPNRLPNNDGVHCSASKNIKVTNSTFLCGDDCFAATCITNWDGSCENIEISDCLMSSRSAAIRFGHLSSKVRNIKVTDIDIIRSNRAIALFSGDDGVVENAYFGNIKADTKIYAGYWWGKGEPIVICAKDSTGTVRNVTFENCEFIHENPALIVGTNNNVNGININKCKFVYEEGCTLEYYKNKLDLQPNVPDLTETKFEDGEDIYIDEAQAFVDGEEI